MCTGKHHSSVAILSLVPAALLTIRQQTHDISLYTLYNKQIYGRLLPTGEYCNLATLVLELRHFQLQIFILHHHHHNGCAAHVVCMRTCTTIYTYTYLESIGESLSETRAQQQILTYVFPPLYYIRETE